MPIGPDSCPPAESVTVLLNGASVEIGGENPNVMLLEWLRDRGLPGAKEGCNQGDCGACTVAVSFRDATGADHWQSVCSCLLPLGSVAGRAVLTVEGLGGELHPIQSALVRHHGSQCGYCTPGIVMSMVEGCQRRDLGTLEDLEDQLAGNLCRCTGYNSIRDAALAALGVAHAGGGIIPAPKANLPTPSVGEPGKDRFFRPRELPDLFRILEQFPAARLVAGGTDLGREITTGFRRFECLVSLEHVGGLSDLSGTRDEWRIGASVTLTRLGEVLGGEFAELGGLLRRFGSRQIRNRATLGGNLVTASPVGDLAPWLLTMDARLVLASATGERELGIAAFFTGHRKTALRPAEVLQTIILPRHDGFRRQFHKVSRRRDLDISTLSACFALKLGAGNRVEELRIGCGGMAATPRRATRTETTLRGRPWDAATVAAAGDVLAGEFEPLTDVRASREYRRRVLCGLLERFFEGGPTAPETPLPDPEIPVDTAPHESGRLHVTGRARYVDDTVERMLETFVVLSPHAHARIRRRDGTVAGRMPGVQAVLFAADIPGKNNVGPVRDDEPLLAAGWVEYHGQPVALVVALTREQAREAAEKVEVEYEPLPALLDLREAIAAGSFHTGPNVLRRGDAAAGLAAAAHRIVGDLEMGGQDHFYLETQACWAEPGDDGSVFLNSSTQHPSGVQAVVAHVLGLSMNQVVVQSPRLGGGFGGKETQAAGPAAFAAWAAIRTGRRVRVRYSRDQDMVITGKRHPFLARFEAGFDQDGRVQAVRATLYANGGWSLDLSRSIADRAILHLDNAYYLPAVEVQSTVVKTNVASNTAFRGFGGPQGMLVIEEILDRIARRLDLRPEVVRERNLYRGEGETNTTHYGQVMSDDRVQRVWRELKAGSGFDERRAQLEEWNRGHADIKRGLALTPVKFGISFTMAFLNQAGALVLIHRDGSVQVNHGGTEMGQGLHTNIALIAARQLDIPADRVRVMPTRTDKVPNTSATAASCSTDLNGMAVRQACAVLGERLAPFRTADRSFAEAVQAAYEARVSLSSTGFYRTPGVSMDWAAGRGTPFHYFSVGAAVSEVEVDGITGSVRVRRVDILQDAGNPIHDAICVGQIEGGFLQGMGWLTLEELVWDADGRLLTHSPDTYKIPAFGDMPRDFRVILLKGGLPTVPASGSKAVGEPPVMLAISVREAIRDAVAAFGVRGEIALASPATAEAILRLIPSRSKRA